MKCKTVVCPRVPRFPLCPRFPFVVCPWFPFAEAPYGLVVALLEPAQRQSLVDRLLASPWLIVCAVAVAIASGLLVGWVGHRIGIGD